jgi:hypothetical protein
LEGCGFLMAVVNGGFAFAVSWLTNALPNTVVLQAVFAFSVLLFIAGRIFFLAYTVALAKAVQMELTLLPSVAALLLIVTGSTVFATAYLLAVTRGSGTITPFHALTAGGAGVAVLCGSGILYVYDRHLRRLREAVTQFNETATGER